jgi:hypothetical protein
VLSGGWFSLNGARLFWAALVIIHAKMIGLNDQRDPLVEIVRMSQNGDTTE